MPSIHDNPPLLSNTSIDNEESQQSPTETTSLLPTTRRNHDKALKLIAVNFAMLLAGMKDGATGALIPYIQPTYRVGLLSVAILYLVNFSGWLVAAISNVHMTSRFGTGGTFVAGASLMFSAFVLNAWKPPFLIFGASFFLTGLGGAYIDAQANTYLANTENSHRWLGVSHATYGLGAMLSPLVVTTIATNIPYWHSFYLLMIVLAVVNIALLSWGFKSDVPKASDGASSHSEATERLKIALSQKSLWILSAFYFLYVGAEVTTGGWVIEFLISVRHSPPGLAGYVASGFWGGLTIGRILLADITHKFGNRRMVSIYILVGLGLQLIIWFVPHVIVDAIAVTLLGFCFAPLFPTGLSVLSQLLPRELHVASIGLCATVGQAGSATFPFLTGAIASKLGVIVMQPIMVILLVGMLVAWILIPE